MRKPTGESVARACLIAYSVLLLLSFLVLGDPREWWITIGLALIPPIVLGNQKQRVLTCVFVGFTIVVAVAYIYNERDVAPARLTSRFLRCESELAQLKARQKGTDHGAATETDK